MKVAKSWAFATSNLSRYPLTLCRRFLMLSDEDDCTDSADISHLIDSNRLQITSLLPYFTSLHFSSLQFYWIPLPSGIKTRQAECMRTRNWEESRKRQPGDTLYYRLMTSDFTYAFPILFICLPLQAALMKIIVYFPISRLQKKYIYICTNSKYYYEVFHECKLSDQEFDDEIASINSKDNDDDTDDDDD